jgi:hypothetical protein
MLMASKENKRETYRKAASLYTLYNANVKWRAPACRYVSLITSWKDRIGGEWFIFSAKERKLD